MIRSVAVAAILGALVAAGGFYALGSSDWRNQVAVRSSTSVTLVKAGTESWPICTTMGAIGSEADWADLDPDFAAGKKALAAEDWSGAITALRLAALRDPRNADIQNYIGYSYRRLRQFGPAMGHYQRALMLNPRHRSAHQHLGELYLAFNEPAKAEEHLAALERICLIPCEELGDLVRLIVAYNSSTSR